MNYQETVAYLYNQLPNFQHVGVGAYKEGTQNIEALCAALGNPYTQYPCLHIAGTNGKGSTSHTLAAILQSAGYRVGLYTSPHLKDFRERIRVNGETISEAQVVDFVGKIHEHIHAITPSFFEITVAMAFQHFAAMQVDIAVIEVGLGGRLDATNIISPILSVITNISFDHQRLLGDTLPLIAGEKAGIIKPKTPVVISEKHPETAPVFTTRAHTCDAPLYFAEDYIQVAAHEEKLAYQSAQEWGIAGEAVPELKGFYQQKNLKGVLMAVALLQKQGWHISPAAVREGIEGVVSLTKLKGRWQILQKNPLVVCDTGHNEGGIRELMAQAHATPHRKLHLILSFVNEKELGKLLALYPADADFHFAPFTAPRAMPLERMAEEAGKLGLAYKTHTDVNAALRHCLQHADAKDLILVSGSTYLVAEVDDL